MCSGRDVLSVGTTRTKRVAEKRTRAKAGRSKARRQGFWLVLPGFAAVPNTYGFVPVYGGRAVSSRMERGGDAAAWFMDSRTSPLNCAARDR